MVYSKNGVNIYQKEADCIFNNAPDQKIYILKVENTNSTDVTVEWDLKVWYNDKCNNCDQDYNEHHHVIQVAANSSVEGKCELPKNSLEIFKDFLSYKAPTKLTKYELKNLQVTVTNDK